MILMTGNEAKMNPVKDRRVWWFNKLRADGHGRRAARNDMRAAIRFTDAMNKDVIAEFVADCAADGVECLPAVAASIIEERVFLARNPA